MASKNLFKTFDFNKYVYSFIEEDAFCIFPIEADEFVSVDGLMGRIIGSIFEHKGELTGARDIFGKENLSEGEVEQVLNEVESFLKKLEASVLNESFNGFGQSSVSEKSSRFSVSAIIKRSSENSSIGAPMASGVALGVAAGFTSSDAGWHDIGKHFLT